MSVLWIIPSIFLQQVLKELHDGHPGRVRMKSLARIHVWWPGIDGDIERIVRECNSCKQQRDVPSCVPLHPWEYP